jgi:hypothetical protein
MFNVQKFLNIEHYSFGTTCLAKLDYKRVPETNSPEVIPNAPDTGNMTRLHITPPSKIIGV